MRVLIAEDEPRLAAALARGLRRAGCAVDVALDGRAAIERASAIEYDAVLLDRDLPEVHGDEVCRHLVGSERPPRILMLTAAAEVHDRIEGLDLGADDYLPKPFAFAELMARLRALQRRAGPSLPPVLERSGVRLDPARRDVSRDGEPVALSPKEFGVLEVLLRADGAVVSPEELLRRVWDEQLDPGSNTARVTVMNLRRKLGEPAVVETVIGSGYRLT
ncbi:MAG TPA: response regulator transcription factor [Solirubrobacteraceae bacterium]|nr:response regulator transcription factor [Solirubrobacteraceae bacterium]